MIRSTRPSQGAQFSWVLVPRCMGISNICRRTSSCTTPPRPEAKPTSTCGRCPSASACRPASTSSYPPPTSPIRRGNSSSGSSLKRGISLSEYQPGFPHLSLRGHSCGPSHSQEAAGPFPSGLLGHTHWPLPCCTLGPVLRFPHSFDCFLQHWGVTKFPRLALNSLISYPSDRGVAIIVLWHQSSPQIFFHSFHTTDFFFEQPFYLSTLPDTGDCEVNTITETEGVQCLHGA